MDVDVVDFLKFFFRVFILWHFSGKQEHKHQMLLMCLLRLLSNDGLRYTSHIYLIETTFFAPQNVFVLSVVVLQHENFQIVYARATDNKEKKTETCRYSIVCRTRNDRCAFTKHCVSSVELQFCNKNLMNFSKQKLRARKTFRRQFICAVERCFDSICHPENGMHDTNWLLLCRQLSHPPPWHSWQQRNRKSNLRSSQISNNNTI